ncbi:hypothetical protein [Acinetobacter sp.]|uniref:hypothetical protein n=1 Tax=Acinetobacter sp. TaxID=472 RepID=UPI0031D71B4A
MSQIRCPYCGSIQIKAMSNQPKKYPRPIDPIALQDWQRGYDCKKCGNDFVIQPKKPLGFGKLIKWIILFFIAFLAISYFLGKGEPDIKESSLETPKVPSIDNAQHEEDPLKQEFSKEAERAAHEYIPPIEKPKSIANSSNPNDTLNIKTTIRNKNE